ncbi:hypothetical protein S40288_08307 [Stachybotrys chartarum IBT 40288]|nr:hypothetical protein S40288_08307 [Stachybotrys chartarum IBT 40288]
MGTKHFVCVLFPIFFTVAAILLLLVANFGSVTGMHMHLFRLDTENLAIGQSSVLDFVYDLGNITAQDLGLARSYEVSVWSYCSLGFDGFRQCSNVEMDWAFNAISNAQLEEISSSGMQVLGPVRAFRELSRWTSIAFIMALIAMGFELIIGILSIFSRIISCVAWLASLLAVLMAGVACILATVQVAVVTGAVETIGSHYGMEISINASFLATIWAGFAFIFASRILFCLTICV